MTPTARSLAWLKSEGWTYANVERRIPGKFVTMDCFGFLDYIALKPGEKGILGLQFTSDSNHAAHYHKIVLERRATLWLACDNRIWLMSWSKKGARGKRKLWEPRIQEITLQDFRPRAPMAAHVGSC